MFNYVIFELKNFWNWIKSFFVKAEAAAVSEVDPIKAIFEQKVHAAVQDALEAYSKVTGKLLKATPSETDQTPPRPLVAPPGGTVDGK